MYNLGSVLDPLVRRGVRHRAIRPSGPQAAVTGKTRWWCASRRGTWPDIAPPAGSTLRAQYVIADHDWWRCPKKECRAKWDYESKRCPSCGSSGSNRTGRGETCEADGAALLDAAMSLALTPTTTMLQPRRRGSGERAEEDAKSTM